jgi:hypothetical protein
MNKDRIRPVKKLKYLKQKRMPKLLNKLMVKKIFRPGLSVAAPIFKPAQ